MLIHISLFNVFFKHQNIPNFVVHYFLCVGAILIITMPMPIIEEIISEWKKEKKSKLSNIHNLKKIYIYIL